MLKAENTEKSEC